jgi:hypothetical protein
MTSSVAGEAGVPGMRLNGGGTMLKTKPMRPLPQ